MPFVRVVPSKTQSSRALVAWVVLAVLAVPALAGAGAGSSVRPAKPPAPDPRGLELFEKQIRPLLSSRCYSCHSSQAATPAAGLRLDSSKALRKGGAHGAAVVAGDPEQSLLIRVVRHAGGAPRMPPSGRLSDAEVGALVRWVRLGAPMDAGTAPQAQVGSGPGFWAFQPVRTPVPPPVRQRAWVSNPVDAFVLARLEAAGLSPAPPADRRDLVRRVTFDLTGLPPTPEEVDAFVADRAPDAWEKVVDRLLASPRYGEKWGRRWLDVARYADSNGLDENLAYANAWRYRDYVIGALNQDLPYDEFVTEQIAGDLLPPAPDPAVNHRRLVATGFLSLGPKMLAEDDPAKMEMDIIDEQLDTIGKGFLGLTLGCARCHDHKFDPIPMVDYYALAGILKSTRTMENFNVVAVWHENLLAAPEEVRRFQAAETALTEARAALDRRKTAATQALLKRERGKVAAYLLGATRAIRESVRDEEIPSEATRWKLAAPLLRQWITHLSKARTDAGSVLAEWVRAAGLTGPGVVAAPPSLEALAARYQEQVTAAVAAWEALRAGDPKAARLPDAALEPYRALAFDSPGPYASPAGAEAYFLPDEQQEIAQLTMRVEERTRMVPSIPRAMGVAEGSPTDLKIHLRGNYLTQGELAPRGFLRAVSVVSAPRAPANGSGRLELARWITAAQNPLTARVLVNRVWMGHFGEGLVRSLDNFGRLGERPSHPELLDWLAASFSSPSPASPPASAAAPASVSPAPYPLNWSLKRLHRLILTSSTYRMSTAYRSQAGAKDPENRLLWRMNRRRLDAEEVRDSILAVSGGLDLKMGGTLLPLKNREYVTSTANRDTTDYNAPRRAVYLPVVRSSLYDLFTAFDFGDPSVVNGQRGATVVAPQALFLMNGKLVLRETRRLADRLLSLAGADDAARVQAAFRIVFSRAAAPVEVERHLAFLHRIESSLAERVPEAAERRARAWQSFCRVLLSTNEFLYLE